MAEEKASPLPISPSLVNESDSSAQTEWTELENKLFDNALAMFSEGTRDRWEKVAKMVPGKTPEGVEKHFKLLVKDVEHIEPHQISVPDGLDKSEEKKMVGVVNSGDVKEKGKSKEKRVVLRKDGNPSNKGKGRLWSEEEHRLFLNGLYEYGKGNWKSISRDVVVSRTPAQVASHAQKHYLRMDNPGMRERQRPRLSDNRDMDEERED
ncbi:hypothetical protein AAC387_Pa07g1144 [Persea americana]